MKILIYKDSEGVHYIANNFEKLNIKDSIIIDDLELPDRTFRNAWDIIDGKIVEDIDKAKEIKKDKIREHRKILFQQNDIIIRDAAIDNDMETLNIATVERDRLRDLPQLVDACTTIDEIKKIEV